MTATRGGRAKQSAYRREWRPAYTEYFLAAVIHGKRHDYYNGQMYRSAALAQRDADKMNARRTSGTVTVESKEVPAGEVWTMKAALKLGKGAR